MLKKSIQNKKRNAKLNGNQKELMKLKSFNHLKLK